jgi:oligoendopeptidase F
MNVHARYLFETRFYADRQAGPLGVQQLDELMVQAQKDAFKESLATYHPLFWASKGHFYMTGAPLYNFPYTFGFLFSAGIYARAMAEGPGFEQKYVDLLQDTARMTVEDLAQRHLGVDLTQPAFWEDAVRIALADVVEFLGLTEQ